MRGGALWAALHHTVTIGRTATLLSCIILRLRCINGAVSRHRAGCSRANGVRFATLLTMTEDLSPQPPPPPPPVSGPAAPSGAPPTPYAQPPYGTGPYAS